MVNEYLESLRAEFRASVGKDPERTRGAEGQIRKILGPMSDEEERYYFAPEPTPAPAAE